MAGSGVNSTNAAELAQTGVDALHLTAKAIKAGAMKYQKEEVSMASVLPANEYEIVFSDVKKIEAIKAL